MLTSVQELELLTREYSLTVNEVKAIKENVFFLDTNQGPVCLKKVSAHINEMELVADALAELIKRGFSQTAQPLVTSKGKSCVNCDDHYYIVTRWIEGRKCDFNHLQDLKLAAVALARFHNHSSNLVNGRAVAWPNWLRILEKRCKDLLVFKDQAVQGQEADRFAPIYLEVVEEFYQQGNRALRKLARSPYQKLSISTRKGASFVHRDIAARNFIINAQNQACLIDFDYSAFDLRITDVTRFIEKACKKHYWQFPILGNVLDTYHRESPFMIGELEVACALLEFPNKFWRLAYNYFHNEKGNWGQGTFTIKLIDLLKQQTARKGFIKELNRYCLERGLKYERKG